MDEYLVILVILLYFVPAGLCFFMDYNDIRKCLLKGYYRDVFYIITEDLTPVYNLWWMVVYVNEWMDKNMDL